MEIRQLQYFVSVAEHKNFTKAAHALFVAQSAVSQQIASLEKELGFELFVRNRRSVKLTEAGKVYFSEAKDILYRAESAVKKARKAKEGLVGTIKIGFLAAPVRNFLPKLIDKFNKKYPMIEVLLSHLTMKQLNESIESDNIDIAFNAKIGLQNQDILECETLYSSSICAFLRKDHPLANAPKLHISDLANEHFIVRHREEAPYWNDYMIELCVKSGFYPNIISQTRRIEAIFILVDAGKGITIFPEYLQMYKSSTIIAKKLIGEENTIDVIAYRKKTNLNPTIPLFLNELREELSNYLKDEESMYL